MVASGHTPMGAAVGGTAPSREPGRGHALVGYGRFAEGRHATMISADGVTPGIATSRPRGRRELETDVPVRYYKYRSMADGSWEYVKRTLLQNEVKFSSPRTFNDPFDCVPAFDFSATLQERAAYTKRLVKKYNAMLSRNERRQMVASGRANLANETLLAEAQANIEALIAKTGIYSLSGKGDDVLMWSHYADCHRGICLRFKAASPFFGKAQPVIYQANRPALNPIKDTPVEAADKALLTKADFWNYEAEYRIIDHRNGPGLRTFPGALLDAVILGIQISDLSRTRILEWASRRREPIEVQQARMDQKMFRIELTTADSG